MKTIDMFYNFDADALWEGMPEFTQHEEPDPVITATFKFRTEEDFDVFKKKVQKHIFNNTGPFRGEQSKDKKQAWFPLRELMKGYRVVSSNPLPLKYPVYIVSKGRPKNLTSTALTKLGVPYITIIEQQDFDAYSKFEPVDRLLILPQEYRQNYDVFWDDDDPRTGPGAARNFAWDHSIENGYKRHWVMDDNIRKFVNLNNNKKVICGDGTFFRVCEDFTDKFSNVAISGPQYQFFIPAAAKRSAFVANTRIYSCLLIDNDIPYRWRGRYNEDTDLCLRVLKDGLCTIQFYNFLQDKIGTQQMKGGNTAEFYEGEGTQPKSQMLYDMHPDIVQLHWEYNREHHYVNYHRFKYNELKLIDPNKPNEDIYEIKIIKTT